jgi:hypothetical protein
MHALLAAELAADLARVRHLLLRLLSVHLRRTRVSFWQKPATKSKNAAFDAGAAATGMRTLAKKPKGSASMALKAADSDSAPAALGAARGSAV